MEEWEEGEKLRGKVREEENVKEKERERKEKS